LAAAESKASSMEKVKNRMNEEVEDLLIDLEKAQAQASTLERQTDRHTHTHTHTHTHNSTLNTNTMAAIVSAQSPMATSPTRYTLNMSPTQEITTVLGWEEQPTLPAHLANKAPKRQRSSDSELQQKAAAVEANRLKLLQAKVDAAKSHLAKVESAHQHMASDTALTTGKTTFTTTTELKKSLDEKFARVEANRDVLLSQKAEAAGFHNTKVQEVQRKAASDDKLSTGKTSFETTTSLKAALAEKEQRLEANREKILQEKVEAARAHSSKRKAATTEQ